MGYEAEKQLIHDFFTAINGISADLRLVTNARDNKTYRPIELNFIIKSFNIDGSPALAIYTEQDVHFAIGRNDESIDLEIGYKDNICTVNLQSDGNIICLYILSVVLCHQVNLDKNPLFMMWAGEAIFSILDEILDNSELTGEQYDIIQIIRDRSKSYYQEISATI